MEEARGTAPHILTEEELLRILDSPDHQTRAGLRDRAILELLGGAGLKVRELLPLCLEDLDLQISCLLLSDREQSVRVIPFGKRTRDCLLQYLYAVRKEVDGPSSLLFPGRDGQILTRQAVWKVVKKYAHAAGIGDWVSPEDLRKALAVSLLRRGTDADSVQEILGIRDAAMIKYLRMEAGGEKEQ